MPDESSSFSPYRFTCEGFLLLWKGCIFGPHDFTFVSRLVFLHEVRSGCSACMILHVSPTCPLVSQYALDALPAWFYIVSHLSPSCLPVRSGLPARMILHFSHLYPLDFHLSPSTLWMLCPSLSAQVTQYSPWTFLGCRGWADAPSALLCCCAVALCAADLHWRGAAADNLYKDFSAGRSQVRPRVPRLRSISKPLELLG